MTTKPGEVGSISTDATVQRSYAQKSRNWFCNTCGVDHSALLGLPSSAQRILPQKYLSKNQSPKMPSATTKNLVSRKGQKTLVERQIQKQKLNVFTQLLKVIATIAVFFLYRSFRNIIVHMNSVTH